MLVDSPGTADAGAPLKESAQDRANVRGVRRARWSGVVVVGMALVVVGVALADNYTFRFTARDQTLAKTYALRLSDLGAGWAGGLTKPDLSPNPSCPGYNPTYRDLIVTGATSFQFHRTTPSAWAIATGGTQVLRSAAMVRSDLRRTITPAGFIPCQRREAEEQFGSDYDIASIERIAFPAVAPYTVALRVQLTGKTASAAPHLVIDALFIGKGRAEISLVMIDVAARPGAPFVAAEQRLARTLAGRIRS
jgi:hypothetical protein